MGDIGEAVRPSCSRRCLRGPERAQGWCARTREGVAIARAAGRMRGGTPGSIPDRLMEARRSPPRHARRMTTGTSSTQFRRQHDQDGRLARVGPTRGRRRTACSLRGGRRHDGETVAWCSGARRRGEERAVDLVVTAASQHAGSSPGRPAGDLRRRAACSSENARRRPSRCAARPSSPPGARCRGSCPPYAPTSTPARTTVRAYHLRRRRPASSFADGGANDRRQPARHRAAGFPSGAGERARVEVPRECLRDVRTIDATSTLRDHAM